jgi:hypothetical protein
MELDYLKHQRFSNLYFYIFKHLPFQAYCTAEMQTHETDSENSDVWMERPFTERKIENKIRYKSTYDHYQMKEEQMQSSGE